MDSNTGAKVARNYDYQHRYFAFLLIEMLKPHCEFKEIVCEWEDDIQIVTKADEHIFVQQTSKENYSQPFYQYDEKIIKSVSNFFRIYESNIDWKIISFWFVSNSGIKGMNSNSSISFNNLYKDHDKLMEKISDDYGKHIDEKTFHSFLKIVEAKKFDFEAISNQILETINTKYSDLTVAQCGKVLQKIYQIADEKCKEEDISKKLSIAASKREFDREKDSLSKKSRTVTKESLEEELNEFIDKHVNVIHVDKFENLLKLEGLLDSGFRVISPTTPFAEGHKECWSESYFTDEDVKSNYDARREITDSVLTQLKDKSNGKIGTVIFANGYFGKTLLLKRIMFELIKEGYCIIQANEIKTSVFQLKEQFGKISKSYDKILIVVDDVQKQNNEIIFQVVSSNTNTNLSFLLSGRDKELSLAKREVKRGLRFLNVHYLEFKSEDAIAYMNKFKVLYPNSRLDANDIPHIASSLYEYSKKDPLTYFCILRYIITQPDINLKTLNFEIADDLIKDCVSSDAKEQIEKLRALKNQNEDLWKPFLLVSILGMFGLTLNLSKNMHILNCCNIMAYQLESLVNCGLIMKDKGGDFVTLHEIRSEEFLTYLYHNYYGDDEVSFNAEQGIERILKCIYASLTTNEIIAIFRRCSILIKNQRTHLVSKLIAESYSPGIEEYEVKFTRSQDLANLYCYGIGHYFSTVGDLDTALKFYDKSIQMDLTNLSYYLQKGLALDNNGKHTDALIEYEKGLALNDNDSELWYNKGVALFNLSKFEDSIDAYDKSLRIDPSNVDAINNKGRSLLSLGKTESALKEFERALDVDDIYYYALVNKAWVLVLLNRGHEGLKSIENAIHMNPLDAKNWFVKGIILYESQSYEEAVIAFNESIRLDPNQAEVWYKKGQCLHVLNKFEDAIGSYEEAIKLEPDFYVAISDKGNSYLSLGKGKEALRAFDEALTINPNDPIILYNRAFTYFNMGNYLDAIIYAKRATKIAPNYASALGLQIVSHLNLGEMEEAKNVASKLKLVDKKNTFEQMGVDSHGQIGNVFADRD